MGRENADTITYCEVDGRVIFLDVAADRYFQLSENAEAQFRNSAIACSNAGGRDQSTWAPLASMVQGLRVPQRCEPGAAPSRSLLDDPPCPSSIATTCKALLRLILVRRSLRRGRFSWLIHQLQAEKRAARNTAARTGMPDQPGPEPCEGMRRLASDFERTARLTRSHDQCLARAIVLARMALARGLIVELVIGVQLRPFAAHAWVRSGSVLLNDRVDNVRVYTPILVL